jgi:OOP family OmpA-OmpF porin
MEALAKVLKRCGGVKMEIAGHTDAQGSEGGNRALSQARAEAVLLTLQGRQVDVSGLSAKGYGESRPIAENQTEAGREANRRIEFTLVGAAPTAQPAGAAPDASADTGPSFAPQNKTRRAKRRPDTNN